MCVFVLSVLPLQPFLFLVQEYGALGVVSALSVAAVQINPGECIFPQVNGVLARYLPLMLFLGSGCLKVIRITSMVHDFLFIGFTPFLGGVYLRFIKGVSGESCGASLVVAAISIR